MEHSLNECDVVAKKSFVYTSLGKQNVIEVGDKTKINFYCPVYNNSWYLLCDNIWIPFDADVLMKYFEKA